MELNAAFHDDQSQACSWTFADIARAVMPCIGLDCRCDSFDEVELGLDEETALAEARRCLRCGREEQQ
jgi:formate dehydrogenase major subunit